MTQATVTMPTDLLPALLAVVKVAEQGLLHLAEKVHGSPGAEGYEDNVEVLIDQGDDLARVQEFLASIPL